MRRTGTKTRGRNRRLIVLLVGGLITLCGTHPAQAQPVQGDVVSVGFQAAVPSRYVVKYGRWFPILLQLNAQGSRNYDVQLRCERVDLDGDRVDYVEPHVALTPEAGVKRVWCYAVTIKENSGENLNIDIVDADGVRIHTIPAPAFESIGNDTDLILDISAKRFTALDRINSPAENYTGHAWGRQDYYNAICVATLAATDLPDRWYGLDAVDVVVWDDPDPDALSIGQLDALIQWVRNGGQLVVGVGAASAKIQQSALAEIMPLTFNQSPAELQRLDTFRRQFDTLEESFSAPIPVAMGQPAQDALVTFRDSLPDNRVLNLIALRCVGSGRVIASAAYLRDLAGLRPATDPFFHEFFDLNRFETPFKTKETEDMVMFGGTRDLYGSIMDTIDFRRSASALVLAAFAFVAAYILLATFGAWNWLKRHNLTTMSWSTFAVFAIAASALSIAAVTLTRGVTGAVHSSGFVDLQANASDARARTYFGYKSNRRQRVDLSVPGEQNAMCGLATSAALTRLFTTPERYEALPARAELLGTPLRATLKQFQAFWCGATDGRISAALSADRGTGKISLDSWIQNELGVDVYDGYLLYIDPRLSDRDGGVPYRVAGLNQRNDRPTMSNKVWDNEKVPPAFNVLALRLPPLGAGGRADQLGRNQEYGRYDDAYYRWSSQEKPDPKDEPWLPTLHALQVESWGDSLTSGLLGGSLDRTDRAALLASTRRLYLHNNNPQGFQTVGRPLNTDGLADHDVMHWLTRGQAVLLLLSDRPGPAVLDVNGTPKESNEGRTLYRVRVPIQYSGRPLRG